MDIIRSRKDIFLNILYTAFVTVTTPRKPRKRPAAALPPLDNQHLLVDRPNDAAMIDRIVARNQSAPEVLGPQATWPEDLPAKPKQQAPATQALPDWCSEAQALMLTEALRDPAPALLTILQGTHPADDINARCQVLADEMEAQWRFLAVKLTDLDRLILRTTLDALLMLHGAEETFDGRKLGVCRRLEARLQSDYQVPAND